MAPLVFNSAFHLCIMNINFFGTLLERKAIEITLIVLTKLDKFHLHTRRKTQGFLI